MFTWGGCGGVVPFETEADCLKAKCPENPCVQDFDVGPCKAAIPRWYYNSEKHVRAISFILNCTLPYKYMSRSEKCRRIVWLKLCHSPVWFFRLSITFRSCLTSRNAESSHGVVVVVSFRLKPERNVSKHNVIPLACRWEKLDRAPEIIADTSSTKRQE